MTFVSRAISQRYQVNPKMKMRRHPVLLISLLASPILAHQSPPELRSAASLARPRVVVISDIGGDPDDEESIVRFLLYSNEFDVEGLIATATGDQLHPELIRERVAAYGQVLPNLRVHARRYPSAKQLASRIAAGRAPAGMVSVGAGKDTAASDLIIRAVDARDPRPIWVLLWGGASDLAQALFKVKATRSPAKIEAFAAKLRVYAISDQDDAGPWIRSNFPRLFWIGNPRLYSTRPLSTWMGMAVSPTGADPALVTRDWIERNIRSKGPLGALYPFPKYIMEGDTPSLLYLVPNGLGQRDHPEWGSWGGRFRLAPGSSTQWIDADDTVPAGQGKTVTSNLASVWRWRAAYQADVAARMTWSVTSSLSGANHNPIAVLNGVPGKRELIVRAKAGTFATLDASASSDPDGDAISFQWFTYPEASGNPTDNAVLSQVGPARLRLDLSTAKSGTKVHVILAVSDHQELPLFAYRRAIIEAY